eukprot:Awhi_evm1s68
MTFESKSNRIRVLLVEALQFLEASIHEITDTYDKPKYNSMSDEELYKKLQILLTQINLGTCTSHELLDSESKESLLQKIDNCIVEENKKKKITHENDIKKNVCVDQHTSISLWQGDITTLEIDGIVNAANSALL